MSKVQNEPDISALLKSAQKAASSSRKILLDYFGDLSNVSEKAQAGLVSEADVASEQNIKDILKKSHPELDFLGEEEAFQKETFGLTPNASSWVVDPLDGTTNYVHRFPIFCISIGLILKGELAVGVIDVPMLDRTYTAVRGQGSFCNGEKIKVSERAQFREALLATGFFAENTEAVQEQLKYLSYFFSKTPRGIRRAGSAAFDLCMVAEGVYDAFWEKNLSPWDTTAGALMVLESGGKVSTYDDQSYYPTSKTILASNGLIHKELVAGLIQP